MSTQDALDEGFEHSVPKPTVEELAAYWRKIENPFDDPPDLPLDIIIKCEVQEARERRFTSLKEAKKLIEDAMRELEKVGISGLSSQSAAARAINENHSRSLAYTHRQFRDDIRLAEEKWNRK